MKLNQFRRKLTGFLARMPICVLLSCGDPVLVLFVRCKYFIRETSSAKLKIEPASENPKFDTEPVRYCIANGRARKDIVQNSIEVQHVLCDRCSIGD
jgi:hypothetical protein